MGLIRTINTAKLTPKNDIIKGFLAYRIWFTLAWHETILKYRRSVIGPFWISITTAIMVGFLGILYGTLLKQPTHEYLPYLAVGLVTWHFISTCIGESCDSLINSAVSIRQFNIPITIYCARNVMRNFIVLIHNLPVALVLVIFFNGWSFTDLALGFVGYVILFFEMMWINIVLAILCLRFRDIKQIVANIIQISLFVSPIIWQVNHMGSYQWIGKINPFFHLLEIVRAPFLGQPYPWDSFWLTIIGLLIGFIFAEILMIRTRNRISYWL